MQPLSGFSERRAVAVASLLRDFGVSEGRVSAVGLAGSRRVVEDPRAADGHLNRRVEIHCVVNEDVDNLGLF